MSDDPLLSNWGVLETPRGDRGSRSRLAGVEPTFTASPTFTIAHLSDIHCGDPHFVPDLMERAIADINELDPDIVVCSGDLTTFGFKEEFAQAKRYLDRLNCESFVVIPGNHDSRNVGYVHF
jgi:3',5'-cyclic-AMP phosphodiesterase